MESGKLRHIIKIQQPDTANRDALGRASAWADWATNVPARVDDLNGREQRGSAIDISQLTHRVSMRYRAGVKSKMRVVWTVDGADRIFAIELVTNPDGKKREHALLCLELNA